jgi:hypothetical protein
MANETFRSIYRFTEQFAEGSRSALNDAFEGLSEVAAGVYNEGEITLLADSFGLDGFSSWPREFWQGRSPLAVTAFGDFFFWSREARQIDYLEVQRQKVIKAADDPSWFLEGLLTSQKIRAGLLREDLVKRVVARLGPLGYGKCFILEPWQMLGGSDSPENYAVGDVEVYVNLVGQTAFAD